jgi:hypothetical protein
MNDDLKPGGSSVRQLGGGELRTIDAPRAFLLAELIALRFRDTAHSVAGKLAADVIATQIHDIAKSWSVVTQAEPQQ